jgi:hypothetical protein
VPGQRERGLGRSVVVQVDVARSRSDGDPAALVVEGDRTSPAGHGDGRVLVSGAQVPGLETNMQLSQQFGTGITPYDLPRQNSVAPSLPKLNIRLPDDGGEENPVESKNPTSNPGSKASALASPGLPWLA